MLQVTDDFGLKVIDFGISRKCDTRMTEGSGTPRYIAPEIVNSRSYSKSGKILCSY